jgi:nucleobase:cation symporter-1, NCS1 family
MRVTVPPPTPTTPTTSEPRAAGTARPYDPSLTNEDLAPLKEQTWTWYNIFAFWMSDVHSVGGYVTAGSLFALGLTSGRCSSA